MDKKIIGGVLVVLTLLIGGVFFLTKGNEASGKYDDFAKCLSEKGVVFYGAFWCSHCQKQKKDFGASTKYLPYIECSTTDGQGQLDVCREKNIKGYPTWEFTDGSRLEGEVKFETLSQKSGCNLPQ